MKILYKIFVITLLTISANAQVGIGTTNPDASAMLDISSTNKGFLLPRLTTTERMAITSPANGLQVYDTDTFSFWYYDGSVWLEVINIFSVPWNGTDDDEGATNNAEDIYTFGSVGIGLSSPSYKLEVSEDASFNSVRVGRGAGNRTTNTILGTNVLTANTTGTDNTGIGYHSLEANTSGGSNTAIGVRTLLQNTSGNLNTAIGNRALLNSTGNSNIALGNKAGDNITSGNNNIIIGANIDATSPTADDQLNIGNWIYGDNGDIGIGVTSPSEKLEVDGKTKTTNFQMTNGATNGYILESDADGNASWVMPPSGADGDAWAVTGEDVTSQIDRLGDVIIGGTAQIGGATPKLAVQNNDNVLTTINVTPIDMLHLSREGTSGYKWAANALFKLGSYSTHANSRSSLEIALTDVNTASTYNTVMTLNGNGRVGIGTTTPTDELEVDGKTKTTNFQMTNGATAGHVLQSDANGNASWAAPASSAYDTWIVAGNTGTETDFLNALIGADGADGADGAVGPQGPAGADGTNGADGATGPAGDPATDDQDLTLTGNTLAISGDPNTDVDLSTYLDNTDDQTATEVTITDTADNFTATNVEAALTELATADSDDAWGVTGEDITSEINRTGNVIIGGTAQIGGATPKLSIQSSNSLDIDNITSIDMLHLSREGTVGTKWAANALFKLGSYSTNVNSRSSLEIALTDINNVTTYNTVMTLNGNGRVGIGTTAPTEELHVVGDILASGTITPDYVFQKYYNGTSSLKEDYKMMSLKEVEAFTKVNKHLPGVPSYKEVEEKGGIVLNRVSEIQLEKIEELFLHTIEQQKIIETQQIAMEELKLRMKKMEKQLNASLD